MDDTQVVRVERDELGFTAISEVTVTATPDAAPPPGREHEPMRFVFVGKAWDREMMEAIELATSESWIMVHQYREES